MSHLRQEVSIRTLNEQGGEYLPGYLGIEMIELGSGTMKSRMPVKKLHIAPNDFLHAASVVALADTTCGYATIAHLPAGAVLHHHRIEKQPSGDSEGGQYRLHRHRAASRAQYAGLGCRRDRRSEWPKNCAISLYANDTVAESLISGTAWVQGAVVSRGEFLRSGWPICNKENLSPK
jgi:hypothetical protein